MKNKDIEQRVQCNKSWEDWEGDSFQSQHCLQLKKTNASDENCFFCCTPQIVGIHRRPKNEPVLLTSSLNCFAYITFKFAFLAPSGVQIDITYAKQASIRIPKVIKWMLYNHHAQFFWSTEIIKWIINISRLNWGYFFLSRNMTTGCFIHQILTEFTLFKYLL